MTKKQNLNEICFYTAKFVKLWQAFKKNLSPEQEFFYFAFLLCLEHPNVRTVNNSCLPCKRSFDDKCKLHRLACRVNAALMINVSFIGLLAV